MNANSLRLWFVAFVIIAGLMIGAEVIHVVSKVLVSVDADTILQQIKQGDL